MQGEPVLKYRTLWLSLGWLLVAGVWYLSLTPTPPEIDIGIDFFDKISHFTAYAGMMAWFMQLYQARRARIFYAFGFIVMGISIEFLQGMGPARVFELADMLANSCGVIAAWLIVKGGLQQCFIQVEKLLVRA